MTACQIGTVMGVFVKVRSINTKWNFYQYNVVQACTCDAPGSIGTTCADSTGQCTCNAGYTGLDCGQCTDLYYEDSGSCTSN